MRFFIYLIYFDSREYVVIVIFLNGMKNVLFFMKEVFLLYLFRRIECRFRENGFLFGL